MIKEVVKQIPFFSEFSDDELRDIMVIGQEKSIKSGQLLFNQGDPGDYMYVILEGSVRVFHREQGEDISITTLEKGACFGELALIDGGPRSASVMTLSPCHLFVLGRDDFLDLLAHSPPILSDFMRRLSTRIRFSTQDLVVTSLQKRHLEDQAEIDRHRAISQMVAGVAHEINTPIGIAYQGATFIRDTLTPDSILELAQNEGAKQVLTDILDASKLIEANIRRADKLVKSFKNLSVRQFTDSLENIDLRELMEEIVALYPAQAKSSKLTIKVSDRLEGDSRWLGYPGYLTQILLNLINNAQAHAYPKDSPGSVQIVLTTKLERYVIEVKDFGCGISEENLDQVFEAFFTTKRGQGGTGLGMAIVHNLVTTALQGTIDIDSKLEQGTTVTVGFPKRIK